MGPDPVKLPTMKGPLPPTLARLLSVPHESSVCDYRVKGYPKGDCNPFAGWVTNGYDTASKLASDLRAMGHGALIFNAANQRI